MATDPLKQLAALLEDATETGLRVPNAAVLSTVGLDGFPNARAVAIKGVSPEGIVITGPRNSRKGLELAANPHCSLTCWWDATGYQVRVQGLATDLPSDAARAIFASRPWEARLIASLSEPGQPAEPGALEAAYMAAARSNDPAEMPDTWGGWVIDPLRIEFMSFSDARFHSRTLYERDDAGWTVTALQP